LRRAVLIAAAIAIVDQFTKLLIAGYIDGRESLVIIDGFFNLVNWSNTGAAWGIFQRYNLVLAAVSVLTVVALYVFRRSFQMHRAGNVIALGLITGGIVGNLIDRLRLGHVVDFLDFYTNAEPVASWLGRALGSNHWPAFNVADSAICVGVVLYIIGSWRSDHQTQTAGAHAGTS
jgi:signal peptidase II